MNWFIQSKPDIETDSGITNSNLYNEQTFYKHFVQDLLLAEREVIIESPYITRKRLEMLRPVFEKLINKGVQVYIITKDPLEHDVVMSEQSEEGIRVFECLGPQVLLVKGGHHRKLAMIDRKITWEGSLNILSQSSSREFMRRIESRKLTDELFKFLQFDTLDEFRNLPTVL